MVRGTSKAEGRGDRVRKAENVVGNEQCEPADRVLGLGRLIPHPMGFPQERSDLQDIATDDEEKTVDASQLFSAANGLGATKDVAGPVRIGTGNALCANCDGVVSQLDSALTGASQRGRDLCAMLASTRHGHRRAGAVERVGHATETCADSLAG